MSQPGRKVDFAHLIKEGRRRRGWRQEDLAAASGVSRRTLTRWEGGDAERPDLDQVRAVCIALGIRPIDAAIALGLLNPDEIDQPPGPVRGTDPISDEIAEVLQDPRVPAAAKEALLTLLRQLRTRPADEPGEAGDERKVV